eukprot:2062703-Pyramimonas_sp.AAC.1
MLGLCSCPSYKIPDVAANILVVQQEAFDPIQVLGDKRITCLAVRPKLVDESVEEWRIRVQHSDEVQQTASSQGH